MIGQWVDGDKASPCDVSKNAVLDYCRQVYSDLEVNNIEDSNEEVEISHWCPMDAPDIPEGCTETFTVLTYTCLVGDFESKALMVPKGCGFEHIHDSESCKPKSELHSLADKQCAATDKIVRDYGMLLPCRDEVDLFTGVEFVCCPPRPKPVPAAEVPEEVEQAPPKPHAAEPKPDVEPVKPVEPVEEQAPETDPEVQAQTDPIPDDPYFHQLPEDEEERDAYEDAKQRLEEQEDHKRTQVMQQWQEAQDQYAALKKTDPKGAEAMKKGMMARFDDTMAELEISARNEHEQLRVVHQHRVSSRLSDQRTRAEQYFAESLRDEPPKTKKVLHALQKYSKAIQRDRQHVMNIYKHLVATDPARAELERPDTVRRLHDMDASLQDCLEMLQKAPEVYAEIQNKVENLLAASKSPEDIAFLQSMETALSMATQTEDQDDTEEDEDEVDPQPEVIPLPPKKTAKKTKPVKAGVKKPVIAEILPPFGKVPSGRKVPDVPDLPMVVAQVEAEEPEEVEEPVAVKGEALPAVKIVSAEAPETEEQQQQQPALEEQNAPPKKQLPIIAVKPLDQYRDDEVDSQTPQQPEQEESASPAKPILVAKKQPQKTQKAAASKMDKGTEFRPKSSSSIDNSVSQKSLKYGATPALAFGLACGVLAVATVMVVAVVLVRRKARRVPVNHGFTEIDPNMTVEQRHIAAMQANGYENPTYKYFEMQ
ncbi:amyloid-beta A4 protein-like isoform X7 [Patiria miniata]|uniref:Amyloid-beta-like protein n=1 Tax=Patiria miniata TaxID=46514 RepID=A0A914AQW5_PATMI|nr:amyloid-beta A4 protein-like isoform X7 [Patiria miniata]